MYTLSDGNMAADGVVTTTNTTTTSGAYAEMFDSDITTYFGANRNAAADTAYLTVDLLKKVKNAVVTAYYSAFLSSLGTTVTVTLQYSADGSTWTDGPAISRNTVGETWSNFSAQVTLRYVRLKIVTNNVDPCGGRMYSLRVTAK